MPYMLTVDNDVFGEEKHWAAVTQDQIRELRQHFLDTWNEEDGEWPHESIRAIRSSVCASCSTAQLLSRVFCSILSLPFARCLSPCLTYTNSPNSSPWYSFKSWALSPKQNDILMCHILTVLCKCYLEVRADVPLFTPSFRPMTARFSASSSRVLCANFNCPLIGVSFFDIDFTKFIFNVFLKRYPMGLGYVIVYDMPWLFNAAWKVIRGWMMPEAAERVKMVNKSQITDYIDPKDLPVRMGGTDTYEYSYVPGKPLGERVGDSSKM
ncbi:unnamed protein product [Ixodes hexagonus]